MPASKGGRRSTTAAIYGTPGTTQTPVRDKDALVDELRTLLAVLDAFCAAAGVKLDALEQASTALDRPYLPAVDVTT